MDETRFLERVRVWGLYCGGRKMLNMTVKAGECIQIGEDVRIVFPDSNISNHIKIGIDAPKEKKVERVMEPKKKKQVVIVRTREN